MESPLLKFYLEVPRLPGQSLGIEGGYNGEWESFAFCTGILQPQCPDMAAQGAMAPLTNTAMLWRVPVLLHCGFHSSEEWEGGKMEDHPPNRLQAVP